MRHRLKAAWTALRGRGVRAVEVDLFNFDKPPHVKGKPCVRVHAVAHNHYLFTLDDREPSVRLEFARGRIIEVSIRL